MQLQWVGEHALLYVLICDLLLVVSATTFSGAMAERIQIDISKPLVQKIRRLAKSEGLVPGEYVENLLRQRLARSEEEEEKDDEKAHWCEEAGREFIEHAGKIVFHGDVDESIREMRHDDPERV